MKHQILIVYIFCITVPKLFLSSSSQVEESLRPKTTADLPVSQKQNAPFRGKEKKIKLITKDGIRFTGILMLVPNPKGNIVLCHPASRDKEYMEPYAKKLFPEYNTIRFDFRFHGEHKKKNHVITIGKKEAYEIEAAAHFFKKHRCTQKLPLFGFGISMGAAALLTAEFRTRMFDGIILQSCFENLRSQVKRMFPWIHPLLTFPLTVYVARKLCHIDIRTLKPSKMITSINTPVFLIHAHNDHFIPFSAFQVLKNSGKSIIKTWTPLNGRHTQIFEMNPEEYRDHCRDFFLVLNGKNIANTNNIQ
jgi:hypothetical protein